MNISGIAKVGASILFLSMLAACGGGGSDSSSSSATSGSATACFNPAQFATGYKQTLNYSVTVTETIEGTPKTSTNTFSESIEVLGPTSFNGNSTIKIKETNTSSSGSETTYSYYSVNGNKVADHGSTEDINTGTVTRINSPAPVLDFGLSAGQSRTYNYTSTETQPDGTVNSYSNSGTDTFNGIESVSTPLGTFSSACKFTDAENDSASSTFQNWYSPDGLFIKAVGGTSSGGAPYRVEISLTSGTVNGVAVVAK